MQKAKSDTASDKAHKTWKWAITETKVRIRQAVAGKRAPVWHFVAFTGPKGREARGVVDLIAIRKDHSAQHNGLNRGDAFQIILIQVKGGSAAWPTPGDCRRLRAVRRKYHAHEVLLSSWKKGKAPQFLCLRQKPVKGKADWEVVEDLRAIFH